MTFSDRTSRARTPESAPPIRKRNRGQRRLKVRNHMTGKDERGNPLPGSRQLSSYSDSHGWTAAGTSRIHNDWVRWDQKITDLLRGKIPTLLARSREGERQSGHMRRFLQLDVQNVVGPRGIQLQSRAMRSASGKRPDERARALIESEWQTWQGRDVCSLDGRKNWRQLLELLRRRRRVDGEVFIEKVLGEGRHGLTLRIWEACSVPLDLHEPDKGIYLGMRVNSKRQVISYFVRDDEHGDIMGNVRGRVGKYREISADRMLHYYRQERANQWRGVPEVATMLERSHMLEGIVQAVLVGFRVASCKMFAIKDSEWSEPGIGHLATSDTDASDASSANPQSVFGDLLLDLEAGSAPYLGDKDVVPFDVSYPPANYDEYVNQVLREMASGLSVPYHQLSGDTRDINYSTARELKLDTCDMWRHEQQGLIDDVVDPIFMQWLNLRVLTGGAWQPYTSLDLPRISHRHHQPRGWQWVDPEKEGKGNLLRLQMGATTLHKLAAEQGENFEDNAEQLGVEDALLRDKLGFGFAEMFDVVMPPTA